MIVSLLFPSSHLLSLPASEIRDINLHYRFLHTGNKCSINVKNHILSQQLAFDEAICNFRNRFHELL